MNHSSGKMMRRHVTPKLVFVTLVCFLTIKILFFPPVSQFSICNLNFGDDSPANTQHMSVPPTPPKPLIVYVAGSARSGSTYAYNLVRILMRQRDPNTIHGWFEDLSYAAHRYASPDPPASPIFYPGSSTSTWKGSLDPYRRTGTSVLVKVHLLEYATLLFTGCDNNEVRNDKNNVSGPILPLEIASPDCPVDLVIQPYRDIVPRMGWGSRLYTSDLDDPFAFCRSRHSNNNSTTTTPRSILTLTEWSNMSTWILQGQAIVACHREWQRAAGAKLGVAVPMENLRSQTSRITLAREIMTQLERLGGDLDAGDPGVLVAAAGGRTGLMMDAMAAVQEADRLRPLDEGSWQAVNPIPHFHRGHVGNASSSAAAEIDTHLPNQAWEAVRQDPTLQEWRREVGYAK